MKNGEQLTPVEWLEQRIRVELTYEQDVLFEELFDQAKAMEKEHSINLIVKYIEDNLDPSTHGNIENVKEWFELNKSE